MNTSPATIVADLAPRVYRALVAEFIAEESTDLAARIQRGAALLQGGALADTATVGVYRVDGSHGHIYRTSSGSCTCPDATYRGVTCAHSFAARLLSAVSAIASYDRATARYELTADGEALLAARA